MFNLSPTLSLSFERGYMLVWTTDGISSCETRNDAIARLAELGVSTPDAIDAIHATLAVARDMAVAL